MKIGIALGVWVSGGISGGHINPAVRTYNFVRCAETDIVVQITLAMAVWRGFPWRKVPGYVVGQLFGGIVGAALVYATYHTAIDIFEGDSGTRTLATAGIFATYPVSINTNLPLGSSFSINL